MHPPFVSLCVPTYNREKFLEHLFNNIATQTYTDFEIVITDNSEADGVQQLAERYAGSLPIRYHKNPPGIGMAGNWNECLSKARGTWVKFMHDDDFFSAPDSLAQFAAAASTGASFIFSSYYEHNFTTSITTPPRYPKARIPALKQYPALLLAVNVVGNPSCTFFRRDLTLFFEVKMKMMADVEFYLRVLSQHQYHFIDAPLISVGFHEGQETNRVARLPEVQIFEFLFMLQQHGTGILNNILVYDAFWRLVRNHHLRNAADIETHAQGLPVPPAIHQMMRAQSRLPQKLLYTKMGSKLLMTGTYARRTR